MTTPLFAALAAALIVSSPAFAQAPAAPSAAASPLPTPLTSAPGRSGGEGGSSGPVSVTLRPATRDNPVLETIVGQPRGAPTGDDAASRCARIAYGDFSTLKDAPTQIVDTSVRPATASSPGVCVVNGFVAPQVGFRMWLPLETWNDKFLQTGCGGRCGDLLADQCEIQVTRGYACLSNDLGHKGTTYDNVWAIGDVEAEIDFGFRATHVASLAGKAILERYYGRRHRHAFFIGASTGGRQALVAVQRFPLDYDGVIGGIAGITLPGIVRGSEKGAVASGGRVLFQDGKPLLSPDEIRRLHARVVASCDGADGLVDRIITDPRGCAFEPAELMCQADKTLDCLYPQQINVVKDIYDAGFSRGSELAWIGAFVAADGTQGRYIQRNSNEYAYPYSWVFNDASNPDIRGFRNAGGKFILYQGWSDEVVNPLGPVGYYESVERLVGSRVDTQTFFRFFAIPGQSHIPGNVGAESIDYLLALEAWVERGQAPDVLVGRKLKSITRMLGPIVLEQDLQPANYLYSRPHYPYPIQSRYRGKGAPDDAASFGPWDPAKGRWVK